MFKEIVSKYTVTVTMLAIWLILSIVTRSGLGVLLGVAVGAFIFEHGLDSIISEPIKRILRINPKT